MFDRMEKSEKPVKRTVAFYMTVVSAVVFFLFVCISLYGYRSLDWMNFLWFALPVPIFGALRIAEMELCKELTLLGILLAMLFTIYIAYHFLLFLLAQDTGFEETRLWLSAAL